MHTTLLLLLFALSCASGESEFHIKDPSTLIEFSRNPSSFKGTVFLDADIDFYGENEQFNPISNYSNRFSGTFDGQGHTIKNLTVNSSSGNDGLFGYSNGLTIKNVVLDASCSITSTSHSNNAYIGGIIGKCNTENEPCVIENSVNMAAVSFNGSCSDLFIGGIVGEIFFGGHSATVKNCVNYGKIIDIGDYACNHIGGITGSLTGSESGIFYVQNCINYGAITVNGTSSLSDLNYARTGGIVGESKFTLIENCLSAGEIKTLNTSIKHVGGISGFVNENMTFTHCFWTNDTNYGDICGLISNGTSTNISGTKMVELNSETLVKLNEYAEKNDTFSKWIFNPNEKKLAFNVNGNELYSFSSKLILLPGFSENENDENFTFSGWYNDTYLTHKFESTEITEDTTLYGLYGELVNVELDLSYDGANSCTKVVIFNAPYGILPSPSRTGHTFIGWYNDNNENVTCEINVTNSDDHTLKAHWEVNKYFVSFDFGNGTVIERVFNFSEKIEYPTNLTRKGYVFDEWIPSLDFMPDYNLTIKANWSEITQFVEIVFAKKDLTEKEAEKIIRSYTNDAFVIEEIGIDEVTGDARVIIRFTDSTEAESFIEKVEVSGDKTIKHVNVLSEFFASFSFGILPMFILAYLIN